MSTLLDPPRLQNPDPGAPRVKRTPIWRRISRRTYIVVGAIMVVLLAAAIWLLFFSSVLGLKNIVVQGVRTIPPSEIGQRADLQAGTPLAGIDMGEIESRVRGIPAVDSVVVSRRWPDTIVIDVLERARVAVIKMDGKFGVMDAHGFVFEQVKRRPRDLPILDAPDGPIRAAAVAVAAGLPEDIRSRVATIHADSTESVILELRSGVTVFWGSPADADLKAQVLRALLAKKKYKWFDVRSPQTPTSAQASPTPAPPPSASPSAIPSVSGSPAPGTTDGTSPAPLAGQESPAPGTSGGVLVPSGRAAPTGPGATAPAGELPSN